MLHFLIGIEERVVKHGLAVDVMIAGRTGINSIILFRE